MKLLLDTCTALWLQLSPERVPARLLAVLAKPGNEVFFSATSAWEIAIKWQTGKLLLPVPPPEFVMRMRTESEIEPLPVEESAAFQLSKLPRLHGDPFDRMLIAQAIEHGLILATPDPLIQQYAVRTMWD